VTRRAIALAALTTVALPAVPRTAVFAAPKPAASNTSADAATLSRIKATMHKLGGRFRDMDTVANLVFTPPRGSGDARSSRKITLTAHLTIKMPDKVKFRVLQSSMPLFNRWIFLQKGNALAAYDPVSDRRINTDFKKLTGHEPARVDTSMAMLGLMFDPSRYKFQLMGRMVRKGVPVYRVRMRHLKPQGNNPLMLIAYTDLYVDTKRLLPVYGASYDVNGNLATTTDFRDVKQTGIGPAPTRITITDHEFERLRKSGKLDRARKKVAKGMGANGGAKPAMGEAADGIFGHQSARGAGAFRNGTLGLWLVSGNGVLYPERMLATTPLGSTSRWTFTKTKVNTGVKDSAFKL